MTKTEYNEEVRHANILRTLDIMCKSWDDPNTSVSDMTHQLEEACKVVGGDTDFSQFTESTNLANLEVLN